MNNKATQLQLWLQSINRSQLAKQIERTRQHLQVIAYKGFCPHVRRFQLVCDYLDIDVQSLNEKNYTEQITERKKELRMSSMSIARDIQEDSLVIWKLTKRYSQTIADYIKIYKIWKNG